MELLKTWLLLACVAGSYAAPLSALSNGRHCSSQTCNAENSRYEVGSKYTYHYNAESESWINGTSEQKSRLKFDCNAQIDVISPCELILKLKDVTVHESNANGQDVVATNQILLRNELEEHVLRFAFVNGVVTDVCPSNEEKTWALNFKRGFLSAIQAPVTEITGEKVVTTETDVTGKCPVWLTSSPNGSIRKYKDFDKCEKRIKLEGGIQATMLKPEAPVFNILECSQECEVSFQSNIVSESLCQERHFSKAFSKQSSGAVNFVRVAVNDLEISPASAPTSTFIDRRTTILFDHVESQLENQQEVLTKAKEILTSIGHRLSKQICVEMPNLFSNLVTEMRKIETTAGMTDLRQFVEGEGEELFKVFKNALPMCETTPSVETMVTIINEVAASTDEEAKKAFKPTQALWMTFPSVVSHPKKEMISAMMPLIKTLSVEDSVFFLPISSLISRYCTSENPSCLAETEVRQAIEYFQQLLGYDCTPNTQVPSLKMLMALKALTNIRRLSTDSKISIINKCFDHQNPDKGMEIRVAALELVRRLPCNPEYQTFAKTMYKNHHFDSELRIAAYRAIMTCPSNDIMQTIQAVMAEEKSDQVGSYVWSHLSNLNETSDPQKQHLKEWVHSSGIMEPINKKDMRKFSRNMELSWFDDEMASGVTIDSDMIFSSKSYLPRELRLNTTVEAFGYAINLFEIGGRMEGMHQFLESFFGPRGFLKENSVLDLFQDYQQKQQEAFLNNLPDAGEVTLPKGLPEGVTLPMYTQLLRLLQFQKKMFGGRLPLPIPGEPMPAGMPKGMTQEMYDELLVVFMRDGMPGDRKKRHLIKESSINDIESEYHTSVEDNPHASVYLKMFGNELVYMDIAKIKSRLMEVKSSMNPMKILMNMAKDQTHQLGSNVIVLDQSWTLPTILGLPLKIAVNGTVSMKVRTEGKIDMRGILMAPRSFEINGVIEPSAALEVSTSMEVMARQTRSGLNQVSRLHSSVSLGGKIQVTDGKAFVVQVNIPDQKQEIIDVSSSIYLHVQDDSLELPGIPERVEKSSCSGSHTTKYFGGQFCTSMAFPKSYANERYPLFPLTGPSHLLVTLEKTDPSLTAWKLEGSYGLDHEMVEGVKVYTDKFHLMFGAPNTDIPRTFNVDFSYNRKDKEMNLNIITPIKTVDVYSKVVNNAMLRKLEVSAILDKVDIYTLDTEVESRPAVVDGDPVINFYPRMDITSPKGVLLKYRSSIGVRDGQQTRVSIWMSLDSPKTSLITVSGDVVKTESTRKVRYSSDLQISGRYVNVNVSTAWQRQKRDNVITVDATLQHRVNGQIIKDAVISAKYTNRTTEGQNEWDLKTEWAFARYPLLSFLFETEYMDSTGSSRSTSKLCYRYNGQECGQDTKVVMGHLLTWGSTESSKHEELNFKIRNPANSINLEIQQHVVLNTSHPIDFSFTILNNTSETEVLNAALQTRTLSEQPVKGDFTASLRSQAWRYVARQDWEFVEAGKTLLNTAVQWEDQQATFGVNFIPTVDEETGLVRYDFNTFLTYPLASLSTNWFAWKKGNDVSHGASAVFSEQPLFAYQLDFTNQTVDAMKPDINLHGSLNISRPMSPIMVVLDAHNKGNDISGGFNVTLGDVKSFSSGLSIFMGIGEDLLPQRKYVMFVSVDIPQRDFSFSLTQSQTMNSQKSLDEAIFILNKRQIFYRSAIMTHVYNYESHQMDIKYDYTLNMSRPLPDQDWHLTINITNGIHNYNLVVFRNKVSVFFLNVSYDQEMLEADLKDPLNSILEETYRRNLKIILRSPLVIMKDVSWNSTLDMTPTSFNFDTRLLYFPNQERPFAMIINYQNKSSDLVTHNQLTTTFETVKRRINILSMAKFDLASGIVIASSSVEVGAHGTDPEKFELAVEYTNGTTDGTTFNNLALTLSSPDNTIKTEGALSYIMDSEYTTSFTILVSKKSIFAVNLVIRNDSDVSQKAFDIDSTFNIFSEEGRIHIVHSQDDNSFHHNVNVYRSNDKDALAHADVSYSKTRQMNEVHTVVVTLQSENMAPFTINTVYTDGLDIQGVSVVVSTSPDYHLDFDFNLVTGSSDTERETFDVIFTIDNTYIPNKKFEVTTHYGISDGQITLNSGLKISEVDMMNIMFVCQHSSSETQMLKNTRTTLSFPQMSDYPALSNLELLLATEVQHQAMKMRRTEFRWGQLTDDEAVALKWTTRSNQLDVVITHPMDLEPLPKEINIVLRNDTIPTARGSFEIQVNSEDDNLMALIGSYALIDNQGNSRRSALTLTRPNHEDIELTLDLELNNEDTVFGSNFLIKYSEDEDRLVEAMIEVVNTSNAEGMGYDVNLALRHLVSGLDLSTVLTVMNDKRMVSAGIEGEVLIGEETQPFNFDFKWNKEQEKYTILSHIPEHKMVFTGQFEDRSYSTFKIYRVTMTNTYNDDNIIRSMFEYNSQQQEISYIVHNNPENAEDFMRFRAGFLNETALLSLLDSEADGVYSVDARLLIALETPKILMTHLQWNPRWTEYIYGKYIDANERMQERLEGPREDMARSHETMREKIKMSWDDFLLSNSDFKTTWDSMVEQFLAKCEAEMERMEGMWEDMEIRSTEYWSEMGNDWALYGTNMKTRWTQMKVDLTPMLTELNETSNAYMKTTTHRVNAFYKENIMPLFEELEKLFANLAAEHRIQMDLLIPHIRPYGIDYLIPKQLPERPLYKTGYDEVADEKLADSPVVTSIKVMGEQEFTFVPEDSMTIRFQGLRQMKLWSDLEKVWNQTRAELMVVFAEIDGEFKQSHFYMDLTARVEELQEQFPVWQWREDMQVKMEEIRSSDEMQELIALIQLMKVEFASTGNATEAGLIKIRDRLAKALEGYTIDFSKYLERPTYDVVRYDLESGEILFRLHLQTEIYSLQQMPDIYRQWDILQDLREMMADVRERSKNTLGEITLSDGTTHSMYELMFSEPMLLYHEGDINEWFQGERIKAMRMFWQNWHLGKLYLNPVNWIPPHQANAMIVGSNHYMTFDRTFYDFSGGCSYLLAHDFSDDNFTVVVEYSRDGDSADREWSIVLYLNATTSFEIKKDATVYKGKQLQELPVEHGRTTIMRYTNKVRIHNTNGITITCDFAHHICNVNISGWYFGKTAGLFGTYNYESRDDFTTADGDMARHVDDFTRSWKVGKKCSGSSTDPLPECNSDPEEEANAMCSFAFLNRTSSLTQCHGVVDPTPYYSMCSSKMCELSSDEERQAEACKSIKAYVDECNQLHVGVAMPDSCVVCKSPTGKFYQGQEKVLTREDVVHKSADIVLIVEEKLCNVDMENPIGDIVDKVDTELKNTRGFADMRYGLLGFGGEGVHDLPHIHTIDGQIFNTKRALVQQGLPELHFAKDGSKDTFAAILAAANYPFRAGVAKHIILLSCSGCQRMYHLDKVYKDVAIMLLSQGIQFNILMDSQLELVPTRAKNTSPKSQVIYGIDTRTVFTNKALSSGTVIGDKTLRKLVNEPFNQCALLAFESGGALFDSSKIDQKKFIDVLTQRMVQQTEIAQCNMCTCKADNDGVGQAICGPCEIAQMHPWQFGLERTLAEANYYGQLGVQSAMDYMNTLQTDSDKPVNKTPKKLP